MKTSAIIRIVLLSVVLLILICALLTGLLVNVFSTQASTDDDVASGNQLRASSEVVASEIRKLSIEWVAGSVQILPAETDKITFQESGRIQQGDELVWYQSGDTLTIAFRDAGRSGWRGWLRSLSGSESSKHLIVMVPHDWVCQALEVDTISAEVDMSGLSFGDVQLTSVSGRCSISGCAADSLSLDTTSGDLRFSGTLDELDVDSVSANCDVSLTGSPRDISIDSVSGELTLTLPETCGFTATWDSVSGRFSTDFSTTATGSGYLYGDGSCEINASSVSGNARIRKG